MDAKTNGQPLTKTFVRGEAHFAFWNLFAKGVALANSFFIISELTIYQYGVFQLFLATFSFAAVALSLGGTVAKIDLLRFVGEGKESHAKKLFSEYSAYRVGVGVVLSAVTFFGAPLLSVRFGAEFIDVIRLFSLLFLHEALWKTMQLALSARASFRALAVRASLFKGVQLLILLGFFFFSQIELTEVVVAYAASAFAGTFALVPAFLRALKPWRGVARARERILLPMIKGYGKWALFQTAFARSTSFAEPWLVKIFIGTEAVAVFSVAKTLIGMIKSFFPIKTLGSLVPLSIGDRVRSQRILSYGTKYLFAFALALALIAPIIVTPLVRGVFPRYIASLPFFYLMLGNLPLTALSSLSISFVNTLRRQKFLFSYRIANTLVVLGLHALLIPLFGLWGLAAEQLIVPALTLVLFSQYLARRGDGFGVRAQALFSFKREDKEFLKNLLDYSLGAARRRFRW